MGTFGYSRCAQCNEEYVFQEGSRCARCLGVSLPTDDEDQEQEPSSDFLDSAEAA